MVDPSAHEGFACLAFTPDGRTLYAGGDRGVTTFDMSEGHRPGSSVASSDLQKSQERATLRGHADTVRSLIFLENGSRLASRSEDGVIKVWDLPDGHERLTLGGGDVKVRAMAPSPDGQTIAAGLRPPKTTIASGDAVPSPGESPPGAEPAPAAPPAGRPPQPEPAPAPSAPPVGQPPPPPLLVSRPKR